MMGHCFRSSYATFLWYSGGHRPPKVLFLAILWASLQRRRRKGKKKRKKGKRQHKRTVKDDACWPCTTTGEPLHWQYCKQILPAPPLLPSCQIMHVLFLIPVLILPMVSAYSGFSFLRRYWLIICGLHVETVLSRRYSSKVSVCFCIRVGLRHSLATFMLLCLQPFVPLTVGRRWTICF